MSDAPAYQVPPVPAFLFDLDGTLIDSVYQHVIAWRAALSRLDIDLSVWRIHRRIGMSGGLFVSALLRETGRTLSGDDIAHAAAGARGGVPGPGGLGPAAAGSGGTAGGADRARRAVGDRDQRLRANGRPALVMLGLPDDAPDGHPGHGAGTPSRTRTSSWPRRRCSGVEPRHAFVVGDSVWDLLAARRAGALGIGVLSGGYGREELERAGAYRVYADPADLLARADEVGSGSADRRRAVAGPVRPAGVRDALGDLPRSAAECLTDHAGGHVPAVEVSPMSGHVTRDRVSVLVALAAPLALAAILVPFRASFPNTDAALALLLVVVAVAANGYRPAGILAAVSAAVWFDFFLTRPYERFSITGRTDIETTVLLLVIGVAVTEIAVWGRRQQSAASRRAGYLDGINAAAQAVAAGDSPSALIDQVTASSPSSCRWKPAGSSTASPGWASRPGCTTTGRSARRAGHGTPAPRGSPGNRHRTAGGERRRVPGPVPDDPAAGCAAEPGAAAARRRVRRPGRRRARHQPPRRPGLTWEHPAVLLPGTLTR